MCREPEQGTENLQIEMMALQRQMSEAHGRQEAKLTAQRTQHEQQLAGLHADLARGHEQALEARQQSAAIILSLRQQVKLEDICLHLPSTALFARYTSTTQRIC